MALTDKQTEILAAAQNETFIDKPNQRSVNILVEQDYILETYGTDQAGQCLYFITDEGRGALYNQKLKPPKRKKRDIEEEFQHYWNILGGNAQYQLERQVTGLIPGRKYRPDFIHADSKTVIELQGMYGAKGGPGGHRSISGYLNDCKRLNEFTIHGWGMIYITSIALIDDPQGQIDIVIAAIETRMK